MGQNFLINPEVTEEIAEHIHKTATDTRIVEIGAGTGNLTAALLNRGCKDLVVVELDYRCIPHLQKLLNSYPECSVIHQDARKIRWDELGNNLYIVGNLPYYLATHLILQWMEMTHLWKHCTIIVQSEVANKIIQDKGTSLSILTSLFLNCKKILSVQPESFRPRPAVQSAVIHLTPKEEIHKTHLPQLKRVLKILFQRRRKMISHALPAQELEKLQIPPNARPEELTIDQFLLLASNLKRLQSY